MDARGESSAFGHSLGGSVTYAFEGTSPVRSFSAPHHSLFDIGAQHIHHVAFPALDMNCGGGSRNDLFQSAILVALARRDLTAFKVSTAGLCERPPPCLKLHAPE